MTTWHLERDPDGVPTLWHGDTAVIRRADLRVPREYADALWSVLVAVYTRPDEAVERVAEQRCPVRAGGPCKGCVMEMTSALEALAVPPDTPPTVADGDRVDYVQAAHVAGAATALQWTERLGEPVGEVDGQ